ncbi:carbohydrate ABC transporter substrate-binding protein, CUT1 family [Jatrophihabitans endophyticus]|uniref:Carbohydrate ABC transporter substrate-binding protein, CUT1 family n=1 Tax=Jatrophihabitans endophyticus TaxID=1206085 RepID=A0A1M5HEB8_9ACTN|nr:extracellular solute-binding protein [Jatrophihabitans endophyticus]SHG14284.1 carbohydrate ABC transporter substrate-binding protein, CUT1 family [Jatrophihabitans endophyticus]
MKRRTAALAAAFGAVALSLAACGGGTGADDAKNTGTTSKGGGVKSIKLVAAEYSKNTQSFWSSFAKTYQQKYGIKLDVQIINWNDIAQQSRTMIQNNNPPDILNINYYSSYAKDGLLYDASQVLPTSVQSDLIDAFKTSGTFKDKLYGFPDLSSARALFYNKTLFKQAGIATAPKTWDEFETDAKKVQALGNGNVGYAMPLGKEEAQAEFSIWAFNNGGNWQSDDGKWTINSKQNVDTLKFLRKLAVDDKVTQNNPGRTNRTDGAFPLFTSGKAGMIVGFGPLSADLDKTKKVDYGIAPMPTNTGGQPATYGVTDYLNAFKKSGNQQAVKDFYELYYQPDQVNKFIKAEGFLPVTKSGLKVFSSNKALSVYIQTLPNIKLTPNQDPAWDKVLLAVQQDIGEGVASGGDPQQVLDQLQKTAEAS